MKKMFSILFMLILTSLSAFAQYKPIPENLSININLDEINLEIITKMRNFDKYEPVPKNLHDKYVQKIPENLIQNFRVDASKGLKHILHDKITYNHKTLKQMLCDFNKKSDLIYQKYLNNPQDLEQNKIFIEQLKEMQGTISLYPDTIIEQVRPYVDKYNLAIEPGAESDIFLYKYYIEKYQVNYSNELKEFLKLKEYVYTKINIYILKISNKV